MTTAIAGAQLRQLSPALAPPRADMFASVLNTAFATAGITSPRRMWAAARSIASGRRSPREDSLCLPANLSRSQK